MKLVNNQCKRTKTIILEQWKPRQTSTLSPVRYLQLTQNKYVYILTTDAFCNCKATVVGTNIVHLNSKTEKYAILFILVSSLYRMFMINNDKVANVCISVYKNENICACSFILLVS